MILLFHGVVNEHNHTVRNYIRKHIDAKYFKEILIDLKSKGPCLSMDEVIEYHKKSDGYPPNAFAITFDDGFENNLSIAAPILEELNLPATFYITTDFIENGTMSWTDKAEYALEQTNTTRNITLPWEEKERPIQTAEDKINLMKTIRQYVFEDETRDPHDIVKWLYDTLEVKMVETTDDPLDKKLSWEQIKDMHENPLFIIGGHTHTHPIMSGLSPKDLNAEIDTSLNLLKTKAGIDTCHYAYPQGQAHHYSQNVIDALKKRDILCCPTAIDGINTTQTDLFHLRRYMVDGLKSETKE